MPNKRRSSRIVSVIAAFSTLFSALFSTLAGKNVKRAVTVALTLLFAVACIAQDRPQNTPPNPEATSESSSSSQSSGSQSAAKTQPSTVTIPSGTRFALVLTNPVASKTMRRGDVVYAQTTAPVIVGDQVLIPGGTFVQGKVEKIKRDGSRAEMQMSSASIVFPDGYIGNIAGPLTVESDEGTAWRDPSSGARAGAIIAPFAGAGIGAAIGTAAHTTQSSTLGGTTITSSSPKGLAIGSMVGLAAGGAVSLAILLNSRHFFVDVGSPMEMTLPQPLTLSEEQVAVAVRQAQEHPVAVPIAAPRPLPYGPYNYARGTCYTAGTPGTPPTVIPGTPATVIPGTPAIPGTPYPCP